MTFADRHVPQSRGAAYLGNATIDVRDVAQDGPKAGDVQVRVAYVGLCGTEGGGGFPPPQALPEPVYTYSYVDKVFDAILDAGARPFVELGFLPRALATQTETVFWWKAHCSPPKEMGRWVELVTTTVEHWIDRYGIDEVRLWPLEVWNEPNLVPRFWTGTRTQYFELYEATVTAIKQIDSQLKVGGPSTSVFVPDARYAGEYHDPSLEFSTAEASDPDELDWQPVWITEFIEYCAIRELPIDFLSTHLYPTDYAANSLNEVSAITRQKDATHLDLQLMRKIIENSSYPDAELHISEWSTSPSSRDSIHDTLFAAPYIVRAFLRGAPLADSISYWTFTDVFEEGGGGIGPFHGGFGFVNEQGLHKPTFHAMAMLNRLGDRLLADLPHGAITRSSTTSEVSAIFYNYPADMGSTGLASQRTYADARALAQVGPPLRVRHTIEGLRPGTQVTVEVLDWEHGNVAEAWHQMGAPLNLSRTQTAQLREVADRLDRRVLTASDEGALEIDLELPPWAVASIAPRTTT